MQVLLQIWQVAQKIPMALKVGVGIRAVFRTIRTYLAARRKIKDGQNGMGTRS